MKVAELLRSLVDMLDNIENDEPKQQPVVVHVHNGNSVPHTEEDCETELGTFIPPLQSKLELLKKSAGISSAFDFADDDGPFED